ISLFLTYARHTMRLIGGVNDNEDAQYLPISYGGIAYNEVVSTSIETKDDVKSRSITIAMYILAIINIF
ncbi:MAG: hypothetical protein K2K23_07770, partial [Muribaculaceae bacterium]|nr:hypothetical protein [Muribaculaceae bacterium]